MNLNAPNVFDYIRRPEEGFIPILAYSPVKYYPMARMARHLYYGKISLSELNQSKEKDREVGGYVRLMEMLGLTKRIGNDRLLTRESSGIWEPGNEKNNNDHRDEDR